MQPIFDALQTGDEKRVAAVLHEYPGSAASRDVQGISALMHALYLGHEGIARQIASQLDDLDFHQAAALGDAPCMAEHLAAGADVASPTPDGFTALHLASFFGRGETVRRLIDHGAPIDAVATNGSNLRPLASAVAGGHLEVVELLLAAGADPEVRQAGGFTPLMGAASGGHGEILDRLLAAGADPAPISDGGKTAADLARERGHAELAGRLAPC